MRSDEEKKNDCNNQQPPLNRGGDSTDSDADVKMSPDINEVACSVSSCSCVGFRAGGVQLRCCGGCGHGWVAHALQKLQAPPSVRGPVEVALPGLVFHLSSLVLFGAQAVPVRLKILLDRLFSVLTPGQVRHILQTLGWSVGDYARGYMLQRPSGPVLDRWFMVTQDEELLILTQFLRFGETRPIVELMTRHCFTAGAQRSDPELETSCQSHDGTNLEKSRKTAGGSRTAAGAGPSAAQRFKSSPEAQCLVPVTKELVPSSRTSQDLQKQQSRTQDSGSVPPQSKAELALKIKVDPDKQFPAQSLWNQHVRFYDKQKPDPHRVRSESRSPLRPDSTASTLRASAPLQGSSSSSSPHPLPSFSSSFLRPHRSVSSTLHPLPSSLSLPPSPAAGRKGRVCCGVCGKSFYDKGTLKIHYNAVHLKVKHGCTVAGCTMVFSSLRSRNRHSANPNPRLHTGCSRHTQTHKHLHEHKESHKHIHNTETRICRGRKLLTYDSAGQNRDPSPSPEPPQQRLSHLLTPTDSSSRTDPVLQPTPAPLLLPVQHASSRASPSSFPLDAPTVEKPKHCCPLLTEPAPALCSDSTSITSTNCKNQHASYENTVTERKQREIYTSPVPTQQRWDSGDSVPKKKPRKSSMPVKIERENMEGRRNKEEEQ
ncbi:zinc finger protein basonuclin-2-like [Betta splendens]|uniref:Zinc finger protein basonuclin-2-like n=1 Tax=Betta splendens TaxID=158456 RepID=A0A8M1H846_BETSP|nr:zinc finger protein basonuclin-2-like [Betta splendens]